MIPQIKEINFPKYATLSTATASLVDMGDKTITTQVKIDGSITPDFSYDWEVEFQGERYIQPLREPQASKGNESISSIIDLTFYHKGIYDLKRYFFVSTVEVEAGTLMADNYIVPLRLNIGEFVDYLNKVLSYYYGSTYKVFLNPDYEYDETDRKDIDINYTKIWDVVTKIYEWFGVRWAWDTQSDNGEYYSIKIGYLSIDVSHTFEYGFDGGLIKFERQVQNAEIANVVFGRGSSENIPYRYFKNKSEDNPTFPADPDWIPELENVYFANLRGKTFRDYVKGWKAKHYGGEPMNEPTEEYLKGYNDEKFAPIEYVEDKESIAKYGEIQKGLEHNEEIKPTIQGVTIDGVGRVDEIVDVEPILVDESTENTEIASDVQPISENVVTWYDSAPNNDTINMTIAFPAIDIDPMKVAHIVKDVQINIVQHVRCKEEFSKYDAVNNKWDILSTRYIQEENPLKVDSISVDYIDVNNDTPISDLANIDNGVKLLIVVEAKVSGFVKKQTNIPHPNPNFSAFTGTITPDSTFKIITSLDTEIDYTPIHGQILGNYESGATRKSRTKTIAANGISQVVFTTEEFTILEKDAPATSIDMPYRITSSLKGGEYDSRPNVVAINVDTNEQVSPINLPAGTYYLQNSIQITNLSNKAQTFKVELLPTYIYYSYDSASWKPTFDIWVKNIWQTNRQWTDPVDGVAKPETDEQYSARVWDAILGSHLGDDAKIVFSSGLLSGHSDYEFSIARRPVYDNSKTIDGVPSEWRITLYKSDAEMEATDKWLPSIMTQASAGDHFYFVGIEMPHQYVLWAEERLDQYKREELHKVSDVDSTIVVQVDKVRINQLQEGETKPLLNSLRVGNNIKVADVRFIQSPHETLHLQSITYTWDASTIMLPNIEVVLSDEIATYTNPFEDINRKLDDTEDKIKDIRKISLVQIDKAKKSIRNTSLKINTLSTGNANVVNQVNALIGRDEDRWKSVREIAEDVANPIDERVSTLIGNDVNKSVRTIANEVLAGASTGGGIDLDLYLSKSEAEATYATKESLQTTNQNVTETNTRVSDIEGDIVEVRNLSTSNSQRLLTLQTEQESQKATIQQQGATILALDLEVDDIKDDVSEANKAIDAIEIELGNKADKSVVDSLSKDLVSTKEVIETKVGEGDLKSLTYKVNGVSQTFNGLSEATIPQIFTPTQVGSQGQVLQSMGGGAPQWTELSELKEAIGFAKDLTGVIEATPEEFTFRPSAGDKSIRDESAVIRRIKGNTIVWEQKLRTPEEGAWGAYIPSNLSTSISGNKIVATLNSGVTITNPFQAGINVNIPAGSIVGHKYLFCALVMVSHLSGSNTNNAFSFEHDNTTRTLTPYISSTNNWTLVHGIWESQSNNDRPSRIKPPWSYTAANEGDWFAVKNAMFFDLTLIFGAGNEPSTYEDFKKVYSDSYFPYCEPELRTMRIASIETIGFNQFDKNSSVVGVLTSTGSIDNTSSFSKKYFTARFNVLPNTTYYLLNVANFYHIRSYVFYDAFGNVISWGGLQADSSANNASGVVTTPKDAAYMGVVVHETFIDKCCINLSHSGVRNGEYHPYKKNTLALPEVIKYFPEGMNSIGDTYDEINVDNAIQRCGIRQYADGDENNSDVRTDKVKTVFILDNPITNPILEPLQLAFDVEDFGTEQTISNQPSSPFRADIVYQFNAEGRIRDNGRNIARLETKVNTLDRATTVVSGRFDGGYVKAEGIIDAAENLYLLPSSSSTEKDKRLANEQYVIDSLPREVAQVLERRVGDIPQHLSPNILYEFVGSTTSLTIVSFNGQDNDYEDVWRVRCGLGRDVAIDILPTILWESGIAPNPTEWGIYEFEFRKTTSMDGNRMLGKFKVYK